MASYYLHQSRRPFFSRPPEPMENKNKARSDKKFAVIYDSARQHSTSTPFGIKKSSLKAKVGTSEVDPPDVGGGGW